jgi:hypothetical protein
MTSRLFVIGGSFVVLAALASVPAGAQRAVREQQVRVSVADRNHAPVKDLTVRDLSVREDGVAREILKVEPAAAPLTVAILADDSQAAQAMSAEIRPALKALVQDLLAGSPESEIALTTFGERPTRVADFTRLGATLIPAVDKVFPRTGAGSYLLDAIQETTRALARKEAARPTIVAIFAESGPEFSAATRAQIEAALKASRVALWTVFLQSSSASLSTEARARAEVTVEVAAASGGLARTVVSAQGLEPACRSVAALLLAQYDVTYARPETLVPPKDRQITTGRAGARVIASRWVTQ